MPRKKKTIKDFTVSFENTKTINTTHRSNKKKVSATILIDFTDAKIKPYRYLRIHTIKDNDMYTFIDQLNGVLKECNLNPINLEYVSIKNITKSDTKYMCDWDNMPAFSPNALMYGYVTILLTVEVVDLPIYLLFVHLFYEHFNIILWSSVKSMWYPKRSELLSPRINQIYISSDIHIPKYPIYIISKGRYEKRLTSKYLEWINVPYTIVIEKQEYDSYSQSLKGSDLSKIVVLPDEYMNLNQGSIPARNFVWWHAKETGASRHWILDDNIVSFKRFHESEKTHIKSGLVFKVVEDYVDRYSNVKMAGHNYVMFGVSLNTYIAPITLNTRIYSSILLSNDIFPHFTWRGKYNEDTDLSLRILKNGYPTILFNCILADKLKTMSQTGGNTDTIYADEKSLLKKAQSLQKQHPDVAKITHKFGRVHHHVDYSQFKELQLKYAENYDIRKGINEYGMQLVEKD